MAVEERVELEGAEDVTRAIQAIARALSEQTEAQDAQASSTRKLTAEEKKAKAVVRERRRQIREQRRQLRALERQRRQNIRTLKAFVGGMTGARFGAAALGAAIVGLGVAAGKTALEFGEVVNELAKTGRAFGLTADEVAILEFQMGRLTKGNVTAQKALTAIVDAAGRAQQGLGEFTRIFDQLGIEVETASGELRSAEELLIDVRGALSAAATEQEALAIATQLFGRRIASELVPALRATDAETAELEQRYFELAGAFGDASVEAESQADALLDLETATRALRLEVGELLSPAITAGADALATAIGRIRASLVEVGGGETAAELAAQFDSVMALGFEAARVQQQIDELQARPFLTGQGQTQLAFLSRRLQRLREATELIGEGAAAEQEMAVAVEQTNRTIREGMDARRERESIEKKTLKIVQEQLQTEKELRAIVGAREAEKLAEAERLRTEEIERQSDAYARLMEAQQAANDSMLSGIGTALDASSDLVSVFSKGTDNALVKVLQVGSTAVGVVQSIMAATSAANAVAAVQSATATTQATAELATIASVAAPAATLSSIAKGEQSIGTILAVVGAILGGVASVAAIAMAEKGASPSFLMSQPAIDGKGHRLIGVMPTEKILDPGATRAQENMLTQAARFFAQRRTGGMASANDGGGITNIQVDIGGRQVASIMVEADREVSRFATARGIA